jgi:hypothetical protein
MSDKRLLYFTANRVVLYRWAHRKLAIESSFANNEEGAAAFVTHLAGLPHSLFYLLVDIVEEDFHQENIPFVRGRDRVALLGRKLAQRYRDTGLSLALSLGYERTQRRDERMLLSAFTNNAQFQPWLEALREAEIPVVGVFSAALLAPAIAAKLGAKKAPLLLVTLQPAGLRQSYVENGKIRFSRLGPLEANDAADPKRVAEAFDRETTRVHQYLTATRVVAREAGAIDALLVAPPGQKARVQAAVPNMPQVRVNVIELGEAASAVGLRGYPEGSGAEALMLHLLAEHAPAEQYAGESLRQFFRLRQVRKGLVAAGAVLGAAGLLWAGVLLTQYFGLQDQIGIDQQRARVATESYARVTAGLPQLPTTPENLRVTMQKYSALTKQTAPPERLVGDVAAVLDASPRIEIDRLQWDLTANPRRADAERSSGQATAGGAAAQQSGQPASGQLYEVVEIEGKVLAAKASDYKGITALVNEFVERLGKRKGVEVLQTKMPFELGSKERLSGDIGTEKGASVPRFTVTVARKAGS